MPWNGAGTFNRIYSWVADRAAGLDISSSRMDTDTNDLASNGFGNCLTRDGQGQPSVNLPMNGFKHTGVQNASNRTDYAAFGQLQDGIVNWAAAGGTGDAITATYNPPLSVLNDGQICFVRALASNTVTNPTFSPNGIGAQHIVKNNGVLLAVGDIAGANHELILRYNGPGVFWELLNPSNNSVNNSLATTGDVKLTIKSVADTGWLLFDDGTFGSATSGSSNSNSAANQALFNILFAAPFTDATAPIFTSTGSPTTRAGQGTAAAAWAANCRMSLPKTLGRALAIAGSGSGLTTRTLGQTLGTETQSLVTNNLPPYTPAGSVASTSTVSTIFLANGGLVGTGAIAGGSANTVALGTSTSATSVNSNGTLTGTAQGGTSAAFSIMDPTSYFNAMVKV